MGRSPPLPFLPQWPFRPAQRSFDPASILRAPHDTFGETRRGSRPGLEGPERAVCRSLCKLGNWLILSFVIAYTNATCSLGHIRILFCQLCKYGWIEDPRVGGSIPPRGTTFPPAYAVRPARPSIVCPAARHHRNRMGGGVGGRRSPVRGRPQGGQGPPAASHQGALLRAFEVDHRKVGEGRDLAQFERAVAPLREAHGAQGLQRLVGVHERQPQRVREVLLAEW